LIKTGSGGLAVSVTGEHSRAIAGDSTPYLIQSGGG
jgi:hypothetical protein